MPRWKTLKKKSCQAEAARQNILELNLKQNNMAEESNKKKVTETGFIEAEALNRYVTETGKILPRKFTGLTAKEQRHVKKTIKHARNMLLMK